MSCILVFKVVDSYGNMFSSCSPNLSYYLDFSYLLHCDLFMWSNSSLSFL